MCTNPGHQVTVVTKFCVVVPHICVLSMELHVTLLALEF
jgi:hypothetical protein